MGEKKRPNKGKVFRVNESLVHSSSNVQVFVSVGLICVAEWCCVFTWLSVIIFIVVESTDNLWTIYVHKYVCTRSVQTYLYPRNVLIRVSLRCSRDTLSILIRVKYLLLCLRGTFTERVLLYQSIYRFVFKFGSK